MLVIDKTIFCTAYRGLKYNMYVYYIAPSIVY